MGFMKVAINAASNQELTMSLTLIKKNETVSIASEVQKLLHEKISPKAVLFEEHNTYFVAEEQNPGKLVLGWGETIDEAIGAAIKRHEG